MRRRDFLLGAPTVMLLLPSPLHAQQSDRDAIYNALLARYVAPGSDGVNRVNYAAWRANDADRQALNTYIETLATLQPKKMARGDALADWGNLYNAITLKVILDQYPVDSIRNVRSEGVWLDPKAWTGPWRAKRVTVEGLQLSLDDIEHAIMRPTFRDPRVHYVVNCASYGCPNLMARAWRAATLEADLDAAARAFVNHPRGVKVRPDGTLWVSSIYRWFIEDFGGDDAGIVAHLRLYAAPPLAERLKGTPRIAEDRYDWSLNRTSAPSPRS